MCVYWVDWFERCFITLVWKVGALRNTHDVRTLEDVNYGTICNLATEDLGRGDWLRTLKERVHCGSRLRTYRRPSKDQRALAVIEGRSSYRMALLSCPSCSDRSTVAAFSTHIFSWTDSSKLPSVAPMKRVLDWRPKTINNFFCANSNPIGIPLHRDRGLGSSHQPS